MIELMPDRLLRARATAAWFAALGLVTVIDAIDGARNSNWVWAALAAVAACLLLTACALVLRRTRGLNKRHSTAS